MSLKDELNKIKNKLLGQKIGQSKAKRAVVVKNDLTEKDIINFKEVGDSPVAKETAEQFARIRSVSLDAKVDDYIEWYYENMIKGEYTDVGEYRIPIELRNFIEKMAVWYELRYPDYEINRLMPGSSQEGKKVSDIMFNNNYYINNLLDENSDIRALDWDEFYNASVFINSLPWEEKFRFQRVKYKNLVYLDPNYTLYDQTEIKHKSAHLHLTSNGFVESAENLDYYSNFKITNEQVKMMHVKDVVKLFKQNNIPLPKNNELEVEINNVAKWKTQKDSLLDAVMYRIIERGGNRMGPRRGFLFAKEFGRNIDVPMMYAIDRSDPGLRLFINEYLKNGGSKDLVCYVGYFSRTNKAVKLDTISIQDLLLTQNNNAATFYTPEETNLHQRLVNALVSQIDQDELNEDNVNQLRLQKKLEKSKKYRK